VIFLSYGGGFVLQFAHFFFCLVDENCFPGKYPAMGKSSFKDSLKALEADIQHANTLYPSLSLSLSLSLRYEFSAFLSSVNWVFAFLLFCSGSSV